MKLICSILFTFISMFANSQPKKNSDVIKLSLKGSVKQIIETRSAVDSNGNLLENPYPTFYNFDSLGYYKNIVTKDEKSSNEVQYTYYKNGMNKEQVVSINGKMNVRLVFTLDKKGMYLLATWYNSSNKPEKYYKNIKTNELGLMTTGNIYDVENKKIGRFEYMYNGYVIVSGKDIDLFEDGLIYEFSSRQNNKNEMNYKKTILTQKGSKDIKEQMYTYENYDPKGNWQIQNVFENGKKVEVIKRNITYYKF